MADWLELSIEASSARQIEQIEEALLATGALSVTIKGRDDEIILIEPEPGQMPVWDEAIITGLYTKKSNLNQIKQQLTFLLGEHVIVNGNTLADRTWELEWTKHFKPICFANRLWICPSNQSINKSARIAGDSVMTLDPGLAFGTGTHPTTAMVLSYLAKQTLTNKHVIDYGCGSGILGIAALKLGASHALLTDIDPLAIRTAIDNATINQVSDNITACLPEQVDNKTTTDLLIANILLTPLLALKDTFIALSNSQSDIILTGLLAEQVDVIIKHYQSDYHDFQIEYLEDWAMVIASKSNKDTAI